MSDDHKSWSMMIIMTRLVELDKLRLATRKEEEAAIAAKGGIDPFYIGYHHHDHGHDDDDDYEDDDDDDDHGDHDDNDKQWQ